MKRRLSIALSIVLLLCVLVGCMVGCQKKVDDYQLVLDKISYIQDSVYVGENDDYKIKIVGGKRETDSIADGKCEAVKPFLMVTVTPRKPSVAKKTYTYKVVGEAGEATGSLSKNVLGVSHSANITGGGVKVGTPKVVTVICDDTKIDIPLTNALEGKIPAEKALEYAYKAVEKELSEAFKDGAFAREVHVKYINDRNNTDSPHYWYVSFMQDTSTYISILVNPVGGSIVSIRR